MKELLGDFMNKFFLQVIITIIVFVIGWLASILYDYLKYKRPIYQVWGIQPKKDENIYIVTGNITHEYYKHLMATGDIKAFGEVISLLRRFYSRNDIRSFFARDFSPTNLRRNNFITIGGDPFNWVTQTVWDDLKNPFPYGKDESNKHRIVDNRKTTKSFYYPCIKAGEVKEDYGFVAKLPNYHDPKKTIIIIDGYTTYGVYAAAQSLCDLDMYRRLGKEKFLKKLKKMNAYSFIIRAKIVGAEGGEEDIIPEPLEDSLMAWNQKRNAWE